MKIITIWHTVAGISGSCGCGFVIYVVRVWGCRQALNKLKMNIFLKKNDLDNEDTTFRPRAISNTCWIQWFIAYYKSIKFPTACLNTNRPVPREVSIWITSTSTNIVTVVYHRFEPFTKVQI